jgi:CDP-glucose 4,6-dehydratase
LQLIDHVVGSGVRGAWNFGPGDDSCKPVGQVVDLAKEIWGSSANWQHAPQENAPHEDNFLFLDSSKSVNEMDWKNLLSLREAVSETIDWEKKALQGENILAISRKSVQSFLKLAH